MNAHDLFGGFDAAASDIADREFKFDEALSRANREADQRPAVIKGARDKIAKSLSPQELAALGGDLDALYKDISIGSAFTNTFFGGDTGNPVNLRPVDLTGPARWLVPVKTPLRNSIPRNPHGQSGAATYRRILGYSNALLGGAGNSSPFFDSEFNTGTRPSFEGLSLNRPQKISWQADEHSVPYVEWGTSDLVTSKAFFTSQGYEDLRAMSIKGMLYSGMLAEERAILYGRGSAAGYAGNYSTSAPSAATALSVPASGQSQIPAGTWAIAFTAVAGVGETVAGTATTTPLAIASANTDSLTVTVPTAAAGSAGTMVYASSTATTVGTWVLGYIPSTYQGTTITFNQLGTQLSSSAAAYPSANTTANNGFDGLTTVLSSGAGGYYNASAGSVATNGIGAWQTAMESLYVSSNGAAEPQAIYVDPVTRANISKFVRTGGATAGAGNFRIQLAPDGSIVGTLINGIYNEAAGSTVDLVAHWAMPSGQSVLRTGTIDVPGSQGDCNEMRLVVDYQAYDWPQVDMSYQGSVYALGTLLHYAPQYSAMLAGITA